MYIPREGFYQELLKELWNFKIWNFGIVCSFFGCLTKRNYKICNTFITAVCRATWTKIKPTGEVLSVYGVLFPFKCSDSDSGHSDWLRKCKFCTLNSRNSTLKNCKFCSQKLQWCSKQTTQNSALRKWRFSLTNYHGELACPRFSTPNLATLGCHAQVEIP